MRLFAQLLIDLTCPAVRFFNRLSTLCECGQLLNPVAKPIFACLICDLLAENSLIKGINLLRTPLDFLSEPLEK